MVGIPMIVCGYVLLMAVNNIAYVISQPSSVHYQEPCGVGEGVVVSQVADTEAPAREHLLCQPCPPDTFSELNKLSNLRLCTQCGVCAPQRRVIRPCSLTRDTVCGDCMPGYRYDFLNDMCEVVDIPIKEESQPEGSIWQQRKVLEHDAIVIVTGTAGVLCGLMILTMVIVWIKHRCQVHKKTPTCLKQCNTLPIYKGLVTSGNKGPYSSILVPQDEDRLKSSRDRLLHELISADPEAQLLRNEQTHNI